MKEVVDCGGDEARTCGGGMVVHLEYVHRLHNRCGVLRVYVTGYVTHVFVKRRVTPIT